ncbi:MAG: hypothetical protein V3V34_08020 [Kiloniellales bacterium]|jgi:H+/Cl- antiporter ClcA
MHDWHAIGLAMVVLFGVLPGLLGAAAAGYFARRRRKPGPVIGRWALGGFVAGAGGGGLWAIAFFGY